MMTTIGITSTVPIEVLLAAGYSPVDLNNLFIASPKPEHLVTIAERAGFPVNCCTWIKGLYGVVKEYGIDPVLCVTSGDCSNTIMLMEVLKLEGHKVIPFAYPDFPNPVRMRHALESLAESLNTSLQAAEEIGGKLAHSRRLLGELDQLTWKDGVISSWENHHWLVTSSDFGGDPEGYQQRLGQFLGQARLREPYPKDMLRLGYLGVPPIFGQDLHHYLEFKGVRVVFNEVQRQFSMPAHEAGLTQQYCRYTYPYSIFDRLEDIVPEMARRQVQGVIHYVQAFCHRAIGDIVFRRRIDLPILTLEGNTDYILNQHFRTRVEAFLDLVKQRSVSSKRARLGRAMSSGNA